MHHVPMFPLWERTAVASDGSPDDIRVVCVHCVVVFISKFIVLSSPPVCGGRSLCRALKEVLFVTSVVSPVPLFHP